MAAFPALSTSDLEDFSGRVDYTGFEEVALKQAALLFRLATGMPLDGFPESGDDRELATYGILAMADSLALAQPYAKVMATPFSSETIGSYSYSKMQNSVKNREPTGILWFDLAVERLKVDGEGGISFGGIEVFEHDLDTATGADTANRRLVGPSDVVGDVPIRAWL